jgi:hypothetical protein
VSGRLQKAQRAGPELNFVFVPDSDVWEFGTGSGSEIDARSGPFSELAMARHEVGMQMRFDDVFDPAACTGGRFEVNLDVALWVDDGGNALGHDHVRRMGKAPQVEPLDLYGFHDPLP